MNINKNTNEEKNYRKNVGKSMTEVSENYTDAGFAGDISALSPMMQHQFYKLAKKSRKHKGLRGFFI